MPAQSTPLTVLSSFYGESEVSVRIGADKVYAAPKDAPKSSYWITVFDRTKIEAGPILSLVQTSDTAVPAGIEKYLSNQYMLCLATCVLRLQDQPKGKFVRFLLDQGAGKSLLTLEQLAMQFTGSKEFPLISYCMVTLLGSDSPAFEAHSSVQTILDPGGKGIGVLSRGAVLPITLRSEEPGGEWFPIELGG